MSVLGDRCRSKRVYHPGRLEILLFISQREKPGLQHGRGQKDKFFLQTKTHLGFHSRLATFGQCRLGEVTSVGCPRWDGCVQQRETKECVRQIRRKEERRWHRVAPRSHLQSKSDAFCSAVPGLSLWSLWGRDGCFTSAWHPHSRRRAKVKGQRIKDSYSKEGRRNTE